MIIYSRLLDLFLITIITTLNVLLHVLLRFLLFFKITRSLTFFIPILTFATSMLSNLITLLNSAKLDSCNPRFKWAPVYYTRVTVCYHAIGVYRHTLTYLFIYLFEPKLQITNYNHNV